MVTTDAGQQQPAEHEARAANTTPGPIGRLSRQSAPRPSRHQALTPKSRAPPAAPARAGSARCFQGRLPSKESDDAGGDREGREAATHRHRPPDRGPVDPHQHRQVAGRQSAGPGSCRSRCGARRAASGGPARWAGTAPRATITTTSASSTTRVSTQRQEKPSMIPDVDPERRQVVEHRGQAAGQLQSRHARGQRDAGSTHDRDAVVASAYAPRRPRRRPVRSRWPRPARAGHRSGCWPGCASPGRTTRSPPAPRPGAARRR